MKRKFQFVVTCFFSILYLTSCKKETSSPVFESTNPITKQPIEQQYAYVKDNLKKVMNELAPLFKDPQFMTYLRAEAAKKFDGDNDVLIKSIIENPNYKPLINYEKMQSALNAFKGLGGEDYYPQFYFPFFDKHQANRNNSSLRLDFVQGQQIIVYDGNESVTTQPIYQYDDISDSLLATGTYADEPYAVVNELLVISLNEANGTQEPYVTNGPSGTQALVNFRIKDLTVKDGKESWVGGASEIHIKSNGTTWNHLLGGNPNGQFVSISNMHYTGQNELKGHEIRKIPRTEIGYPIWNINFIMQTNWKVDIFFADPIVYTYAIFEYDAFPATPKNLGSRISTPNPANSLDVMNFRSSNTAYGRLNDITSENYAIYGNVFGLPASYNFVYYDGYHVNTSDIEFNTVKY